MGRLEKFIKELEKLTKKYNFEIGGCGCCFSPWITDLNEEYKDVTNLIYDREKEKYTYDYEGKCC